MTAAGADDKRQPEVRDFLIDPDPRELRRTLTTVRESLAELEVPARRRVEYLVAEIVGRSSDARRASSGLLRLRIIVQSTAVRIEISGPALLLPSEAGVSDRATEVLLPAWLLDGLTDRWGFDRRSEEPGIWLLVERGGDRA